MAPRSFGDRARLQAAVRSVKAHPTRAKPRSRIPATSLIEAHPARSHRLVAALAQDPTIQRARADGIPALARMAGMQENP